MGKHLETLSTDMKAAMKSGDKARLEVIRMLLSELKRKAIDNKVDALPEEEEVTILRKAVKQLQETINEGKEGGRADVVQKAESELAVIQAYLPQQMDPAALAAVVGSLAAEIGYAGPKDTGRFMKEWMARHKALADGKTVQDILKTLG